jgi:predicted hydrolase (HD superfamily)
MGRLGSGDRGRAVAPKNAMSVGCVINRPRCAALLSTEEAVYPPMRWRISREKTKMKRAIKIENLKPLCATDSQVLRVIALKLGEDSEKYVDYGLIADSIGKTRDAVRKSVNRMIKRQILAVKNGKLAIENAVQVQ